jgi:hypothetical protein
VSFLCSNEQTLVSSPTTGQPLFIQQHQFHQNHQTISHISLQIVWSLLNKCMNKHEQQYQIRRQETTDTITADKWIASSGLDIITFGSTHIRLLQAQQQATTILQNHINLLTNSQRRTLEYFQKQMAHKNTRIKLKSQAAIPVLNISSKINRQLFKQHKKITKA